MKKDGCESWKERVLEIDLLFYKWAKGLTHIFERQIIFEMSGLICIGKQFNYVVVLFRSVRRGSCGQVAYPWA